MHTCFKKLEKKKKYRQNLRWVGSKWQHFDKKQTENVAHPFLIENLCWSAKSKLNKKMK